ncbi:hypothetical protein [Mycoplana sp. MJR14]|uniref:hypothetical protein n=1 Tax=Mycoplana sp. MJR14 TaxID=3032583 RepID=UPI0023DB14D8|nr:hypothetical protein [Mycoplana sp. MJR14]MDF1632068.1 hypothetical protein [Mycoplana sp. MJR14]
MDRVIAPSWAATAALVCSLLAGGGLARAETCPSIDSLLELVRERGGQHRLLDSAELGRSMDTFEGSATARHRSWTSGIMAVFPDGSGLLLLTVNTSVCGIIEIRPSARRWMPLPS